MTAICGSNAFCAAESMASKRAIRGVLANFLGTYTSRYSDFGGYWIFGFLFSDLAGLQINLLAPNVSNSSIPLNAAVQLAAVKFEDQLQKAGLIRSQVREAWLTIEKLPEAVDGWVNIHLSNGYNFSFSAGAVMEGGKRYERRQIVFVAAHNVNAEYRSGRAV